jgi:hypothetical protein
MRVKSATALLSMLTAGVLTLSLALATFATAAYARDGDWADRQKKHKRWQQTETDQNPKPKEGKDER